MLPYALRRYIPKCSGGGSVKRFAPIALLVLMLLLSACAGASPADTPLPPGTGTDVPAAETSPPQVAPTPQPTAAPPPAPTLVLLTPQGCAFPYEALCAALEQRTTAQGWQMTSLDALPASLPPGTQAVVALPGVQGLGEAAQATPQVPFLAVGMADPPALPNLSVLDPAGAAPEKQAFLAGYIAAVATEDWRAGVLLPAAGEDAARLRSAFEQGAVYFCGLCRPAYPPFYAYPVFAAVDGNAGTAVQALAEQAVAAVYLPASVAADESVLQAVQDESFRLIASAPLPAALESSVIAFIRPAPEQALETLWPALTGGEALRLPMPLGVDAPGLSPGRQRLVMEVAAALQDGRIQVLDE